MKLYYGNLNKEQKADSLKENIFTNYFSEYINTPPPNFAESTEEVSKLITLQSKLKKESDYVDILDFTELFDLYFAEKGIPYIYDRLNIKKNQKEIDFIYNLSQEIGALILRLKEYYNRARPYQVAYYSNQNFHPFPTLSGHSPSYPSGHASQSLLICKYLANKYPSKKQELNLISDEIAFSRLVLGCHFPSDNKFSKQLTNSLCQKSDIKEKYFS